MNEEKIKIFCPTCGDVTDGHPEKDRILAEILVNGHEVQYAVEYAKD